MDDSRKSAAEVQSKIEDFRRYLAEDVARRIFLSNLYLVRDTPQRKADWPENYSNVFKSPSGKSVSLGPGVYLHFDQKDTLLYVGKAVSIGTRLGAYFQYGDQRTRKIVDEALEESCGVRVIPLDEEIGFLAASLEWFLIQRLAPPVNKQGRCS